MNVLVLLAAWIALAVARWRRRPPNIVRQVEQAQAWRRELAHGPRSVP